MTGPWPGQMVSISCAAGERVQAVQRLEVGAQLAVRVGHHRGAAAEHGVAGEHGTLRGQHERQRVGGVAGRRDDVHLEAVDRHHVAGAEALRAEPVRRVEGSYAAPDATRRTRAAASEWSRWWWVSSTTATSPAAARTASRCAGDRTAPGRPPPTATPPGSRSTHVLVPSRVIGEALSASTHTARDPKLAARPGHESRCSTSVRSRSGIDSDAASPVSLDLRHEDLDRPAGGAAASTSRGEACRPTSRQVR